MAALREVVTTLWWMSIGVAVLTLSHLIGTVFDVLGLDEGGFIFIRLLTTECCPFLIGSCFCAAILSRRIDLALGVGISTSSESEDMSESAGERPPPGPSPYPTFIPFVENGPTDPEPGRLRTSSVTGQDTSVGAASAVRRSLRWTLRHRTEYHHTAPRLLQRAHHHGTQRPPPALPWRLCTRLRDRDRTAFLVATEQPAASDAAEPATAPAAPDTTAADILAVDDTPGSGEPVLHEEHEGV
ncbi:hypothetical protein DFJ73DRAFT_871571, partial [Zopfochytrium polystomum]